MDERTIQPPPELPVPSAATPASPSEGPSSGRSGLEDPRALTILTTEHWSLLSARGLVYNEAFARAGTFLTFLSATLVALGLVSTGLGFRREFLLIAAGVLSLDLFIGLATLSRVAATTTEDVRFLQGMNRLRHAYHEMVPGLEPYFITGSHDDMPGVFAVYTAAAPTSRSGALHGLTTVAGMLAVICAVVTSVLVGILLLLLTGIAALAAAGMLVVLVAGLIGGIGEMHRRVGRLAVGLDARFPTPGAGRSG